MSRALYCRPSDILTDAATVSVTSGATAAAYPVANISDRKAHSVAKSSGTSITYRAVFGGSKTLQGVVLVNTDATAVTLSNAAGLSVSIAIPSTPEDGLHLDPWIDLRDVANTSSATWNIALTGPSGVALGEWLLIETWRDLPILWDALQEGETHGTILHVTDYGVRLKLGLGVRQRVVTGRTIHDSFRASLVALQRDAEGPRSAFALILDQAQNDALYVDLTDDTRSVNRIHPRASNIPLAFIEQQKGWL